jgi:hypothetical protein
MTSVPKSWRWQGFADAPPRDFAKASFAELYAWSLTQPPAD